MISLKLIAASSTVATLAFVALLQRRGTLGIFSSAGVAILSILFELILLWCYHSYIFPYYVSPLRDIPMPKVRLAPRMYTHVPLAAFLPSNHFFSNSNMISPSNNPTLG